MAKQSNQKLRLLYINKILHESTDEFHGITLAQISEELARYGIYAERKTLYDDIECLRLFGIDIEVKRDSRVRYYVAKREMSGAELRLICDLLEFSSSLSQREKSDLEKRIGAFGGKYGLQTKGVSQKDGDASFEIGALQSATLIYRAMAGNRKINCRCFDWNSQKQRILSNGGATVSFSPWYADFSNGFRFIVFDDATESFKEIRAERVLDVKILDVARSGDADFLRAMENGEIARMIDQEPMQMLRFRASDDCMNDIVDYFGIGITVTSHSDNKFEFSVRCTPDKKLFSWLFMQGGRVEIIAPDTARQEYIRSLNLAMQNIQ